MQEIDINKATQPYEYYLKYIKENCRPDNRKLGEIRPCSVRIECIHSTVNGSAMVKLGSTTVVCGIQARLFTPKIERPDRGYLVPNVELPALCSSKNFTSASGGNQSSGGSGGGGAQTGTQSVEQTQAMLTQLMLDILLESKCIDEKSLCLKEGKLAWALYIDLICLNNDGNVQDACCLAMISALKTLKLYEIEFVEDEAKLTYPLKQKLVQLNCEPVCTTMFAIEDSILLSDPNKQEEDFGRSFLIICTVNDTHICLMRKFGGGFGMNQEQMNLCIGRALQNGTHVRDNVYKF